MGFEFERFACGKIPTFYLSNFLVELGFFFLDVRQLIHPNSSTYYKSILMDRRVGLPRLIKDV